MARYLHAAETLIQPWPARVVQCAVALALFVLSVQTLKDYAQVHCDIPNKISQVALLSLTTIISQLYLVPHSLIQPSATSLSRVISILAFLLDAFFTLLWTYAAHDLLRKRCADICSACRVIWAELDGCQCTTIDGHDAAALETAVGDLTQPTRRVQVHVLAGLAITCAVAFAVSFAFSIIRAQQTTARKTERLQAAHTVRCRDGQFQEKQEHSAGVEGEVDKVSNH